MSKRKKSPTAQRKGTQTAAKKGRRYTPQQKKKALELASRVGVEKAAKRTGISVWSIYSWRNALLLAPLFEKPAPQPAGRETTSLPRPARVPKGVVKQAVGNLEAVALRHDGCTGTVCNFMV